MSEGKSRFCANDLPQFSVCSLDCGRLSLPCSPPVSDWGGPTHAGPSQVGSSEIRQACMGVYDSGACHHEIDPVHAPARGVRGRPIHFERGASAWDVAAVRSRSLKCGLMEASPESRGGANSRESRLGDSI